MAKEKEILKENDMPEDLKAMHDEYDELCDLINSETFANIKKRSEKLIEFIQKNINMDGSTKEGAKVETTALQKSLIITQYNVMISAISSINAYEGVLRERLNYDDYNFHKNKEIKNDRS